MACPAKPLRRSMAPAAEENRMTDGLPVPKAFCVAVALHAMPNRVAQRRGYRSGRDGRVPHGGRTAPAAEENRMTDGLPVPKASCVAASLCDALCGCRVPRSQWGPQAESLHLFCSAPRRGAICRTCGGSPPRKAAWTRTRKEGIGYRGEERGDKPGFCV